MTSAFLDAPGADGPPADRATDSFLWRGEVSVDNGATWRVVTGFAARRRHA